MKKSALPLPLVAGLLLAACSGGAGSPSADGSGGAATTVSVLLTDAACKPDPASVPAGPVTFEIRNEDAGAVSEFEIMQGDRILGERENLAPGLSGSFSLQLEPGDYVGYCPGARTERTTFTVTAATAPASAAAADPRLPDAVAQYRDYVIAEVDDLVTATRAFVMAVKAGDVAEAKRLYPAARVPYERIEPVAESFGDLDPRIDARINDVEDPSQWSGFHKIERALWEENTADGMGPVADQLLADVQKLQQLVADEHYQPAQLANGASELLDEVAHSKVTGEEEAYSHLDLLDFAANVEGAQKAFTLLQPVLADRDAQLAAAVERQFATVMDGLAQHRDGDGYVSYDKLSEAEIRKLATSVDALAEPLSMVASTIVG